MRRGRPCLDAADMTTDSRDHARPATAADRPDRATARRTRRRRGLAVLAAAAAALTIWVVAVPLAGAELDVRTNGGTQPVGPGAVVVASLLAGLAGWALLAVAERVGRRPRRTWTLVAGAVPALSMAGPLGGVGVVAKLVLVGMHLAVGAVLIGALPGSRGAS
jgi:hypothetical protein